MHRMPIEDMKRSLTRPRRIDSTIGDSKKDNLAWMKLSPTPPLVDVVWYLVIGMLGSVHIRVCMRFGEDGCDWMRDHVLRQRSDVTVLE